jgi:hypothetical protein
LPRRKRPVCPGKSINLDDHWVMLLDVSWTIEFSPLLVLAKAPASPPAGVFYFRNAADSGHAAAGSSGRNTGMH